MVKTIKEFKDELRTIRRELYQSGEFADPRLIMSWLDRLVIALEEIAPKLDLMMVEIEQLSKRPAKAAATKKKAKKKVKKKIKKTKKKVKKKSKKKKRR